MLDLNFTLTAVFCQQAAERLAARGGGTICAFSSVAGDRARRSNYLYGASKAGLSAFLEGLHLAYADRGVRVVCVRPGFVKTAMTAGLPVPPFAGEPDTVAPVVLRAIDRGTPVVYAPPIWRVRDARHPPPASRSDATRALLDADRRQPLLRSV